MTKDWKTIAAAMGVKPANDAALAPLDGLESSFRPLVTRLQPDDDFAVLADEEKEAQ